MKEKWMNFKSMSSEEKRKQILQYIKRFFLHLGKIILKFLFKCFELAIIFSCICLFVNWSNDTITTTNSVYENAKIPSSFNGYKIAQISDVNGKDVGTQLADKVKAENPDIIVVTGDYINSERTTEYTIDMTFFELCKNYPIYFVPGDQEKDSNFYNSLKKKLTDCGVTVLDNKAIPLKKGSDSIELLGLNDAAFFHENLGELNNKLKKLSKGEQFKLLLSHRPDLIDIYTQNNIDLVLSGHALGGQVRLPFVGAIFSSNQGFYPNYTSGFYTQDSTTLYVSRGIGTTFIPIRLGNKPELNIITLKTKN